MCDGLAAKGHKCAVLRSDAWAEPPMGVASLATTQYRADWNAKLVTEQPISAERAVKLAEHADLVLSVDRLVAGFATRGHRALLLSNLAYENERTAAEGGWDAIWVPSPYVADQLRRSFGTVPIDVVPPLVSGGNSGCAAHPDVLGLTAQLAAAGIDRNRRLLFPHRADPGKGLTETIKLLARLRRDSGEEWQLIVSRHTDEGTRGTAAIRDAEEVADKLGIAAAVSWIPWLPTAAMRQLYELAGCTLVASRLPEAFSLTTLESVLAGVPVVARSVGNVPGLARQFQAVRAVDSMASVACIHAVRAAVERPPGRRERARVQGLFGQAAHDAALVRALDRVLAS